MSNIETLLEKIEADSKQEQQSIIDAARQKAEEIVRKAEIESREKSEVFLKKAEQEAENLIEKATGRAELEARDQILKIKQSTIEKVIELAVDKLNDISNEDYLEYIKREVAGVDLSENAELKVMAKYREYIVENFKEIKISEETVNSGFAVQDGNVLYNNDFAGIIENNRSDIESLIYKDLFSNENLKK